MPLQRRKKAGALTRAAQPQPDWLGPERQWLAARGPQLAAVAQQVKMLTALVNAEKQFYDVSGIVNPVGVPVGQYLTGVPEGDDSQTRAGRSIRVKELDVRMHFYSAAAATNSVAVRVLVVKDMQPQGANPTLAQILQGGGGGAASVDGQPVLDTRQGRFTWLYDETFTLGTLAGGNDTHLSRVNLKLDHHIQYIDATGATTGAGSGSLYLFVFTDGVAGNTATGSYYSRIRFYDN